MALITLNDMISNASSTVTASWTVPGGDDYRNPWAVQTPTFLSVTAVLLLIPFFIIDTLNPHIYKRSHGSFNTIKVKLVLTVQNLAFLFLKKFAKFLRNENFLSAPFLIFYFYGYSKVKLHILNPSSGCTTCKFICFMISYFMMALNSSKKSNKQDYYSNTLIHPDS